MTGAEGFTLTHHTWTPRPGAEREFDVHCWQYLYKREDIVHATQDIGVPNGMWYREWGYGRQGTLVGADWADIEQRRYTDEQGAERTALVWGGPFGIVTSDYGDIRKTLTCARQIHKGELGSVVSTAPLPYVRQAALKQRIGMSARERRRSNLAWVRFTDLAKAAYVSPNRMTQMVLNCWQFSGHLFYPEGVHKPVATLVDITLASSEDEIKGRLPEDHAVDRASFRAYAVQNTETLWIRRGFAYTILRLQALGYMPAMQTA